jgi:Rrf2 family protein
MLIEDDTIIFLVDGDIVFGLTSEQQRMMCLSQTTGYAVYALSRVDDSRGQPRRIRDIAEHTGLPKAYLARIVSQLAHSGIIHAKRGYRGGIVLTQPAEEISLLRIVEAVEGKNWLGACLLGLDHCAGFAACPTQAMWKRLRDEITGVLRTTTLADVIRCARGTQPGSTRGPQRGSQRTGKRGRETLGSGPGRKIPGPSERQAWPIPSSAHGGQTTQARPSKAGEAGPNGPNAKPARAKSI